MSNRDDLFGSMLPNTLVGVAIWVLMFAFGVALSGLIFFGIYQTSINSIEDKLIKSEERLNKRMDLELRKLESRLKDSSDESTAQNLRVSTTDKDLLIKTVGPSIARIEGKDLSGKATKGSGFVVKSTGSESWVITNNRLVAGSMKENLPVRVRVGGTELDSELLATDPGNDLAVVLFRKGGVRGIPFSKAEPQTGTPVWAVGIKPGTAFGVSADKAQLSSVAGSLSLDKSADPLFSGGPLLDADAKVIGVITTSASGPAGSSTTAVPINRTCAIVLRCPKANPSPGPSPTAKGRPRSPKPPPVPAPVTDSPPEVAPSFDSF
ncbi:MAG: S1 family peptidase [Actinomycetota bacterium]